MLEVPSYMANLSMKSLVKTFGESGERFEVSGFCHKEATTKDGAVIHVLCLLIDGELYATRSAGLLREWGIMEDEVKELPSIWLSVALKEMVGPNIPVGAATWNFTAHMSSAPLLS